MSQFVKSYLEDLLTGLRLTQNDYEEFISSVCSGLVNISNKRDVIEYLAREAQFRIDVHYDFYILAGRILVRHQLEQIPESFSAHARLLYENFCEVASDVIKHVPLIGREYLSLVLENQEFFDSLVDLNKEYDHRYMEYCRNREKFFKKVYGKEVDCVQYMLLQITLQLYPDDFNMLEKCYRMMSNNKISMATPIRANSCMPKNPLASCFITRIREDSIDRIFQSLCDAAMISQNSGRIGIDITDVRAKGDMIKGSNGVSSGIGMILRVFNKTMRYVDQGGNKRKGATMVCMSIWHLDVRDFLRIRHHSTVPESCVTNFHHCVSIPDIFMQRVISDQDWTMFSPHDAEILLGKKLNGLYGDDFNSEYLKCESQLKNTKTMKARRLFFEICKMQCETGEPFLFFVDSANLKSNQKNLGPITTPNLCTKIMERSGGISVCNLRAVILPAHVKGKEFDFLELQKSVKLLVNSCDRSIDRTYYPTSECELINNYDRPIAIGVIGLSSLYKKLGLSWNDSSARDLNRRIFANIYYAALDESCDLARINGVYSGYKGSPISEGLLQFDLWNTEPDYHLDWLSLRSKIKRYGVRNSMLIGPIPTTSTSQYVKTGFSEGLFPNESNITLHGTTAGSFIYVEREMAEMLIRCGLWSKGLIRDIQKNRGSVQNVKAFPEELKPVYRTAFEYLYKVFIDQTINRAPYIDQSQSINNYVAFASPDEMIKRLFDLHLRAWRGGLKSVYYTRSMPISHSLDLNTESSPGIVQKKYCSDSQCDSCIV